MLDEGMFWGMVCCFQPLSLACVFNCNSLFIQIGGMFLSKYMFMIFFALVWIVVIYLHNLFVFSIIFWVFYIFTHMFISFGVSFLFFHRWFNWLLLLVSVSFLESGSAIFWLGACSFFCVLCTVRGLGFCSCSVPN